VDGGDNVVALRVDHSRFADSRFYTGSRIHRNVRLVIVGKLRIAHWGISVTTSKIKSGSAVVHIETTVEYHSVDQRNFSLQSYIVAPAEYNLSARVYDRILKLARTIADLAGAEKISSDHVVEAIQFQSVDRQLWG
jgi:hypothetical protein